MAMKYKILARKLLRGTYPGGEDQNGVPLPDLAMWQVVPEYRNGNNSQWLYENTTTFTFEGTKRLQSTPAEIALIPSIVLIGNTTEELKAQMTLRANTIVSRLQAINPANAPDLPAAILAGEIDVDP